MLRLIQIFHEIYWYKHIKLEEDILISENIKNSKQRNILEKGAKDKSKEEGKVKKEREIYKEKK